MPFTLVVGIFLVWIKGIFYNFQICLNNMGRIRIQNMLTFDAWILLIRSAHLGDDIIADDGERYLDADGLQLPDHGKDLLLVSGQLAANLQHQVNVTFQSLHRIKKMFVLRLYEHTGSHSRSSLFVHSVSFKQTFSDFLFTPYTERLQVDKAASG